MLDFLENNGPVIARKLIGYQFFVRESDNSLTGGIITETEAYTAQDAASHSFRGKTTRNEVMFGPAGYIYVYFTYGMHWCVNIVTGAEGNGQAVLIRTIVLTQNLKLAQSRRSNRSKTELTNGPAKICQALHITGKDNGTQINGQRFILIPPSKTAKFKISAGKRIGITQDTYRLWRFVGTNT